MFELHRGNLPAPMVSSCQACGLAQNSGCVGGEGVAQLGRKARVLVSQTGKTKYASAHDMRRSFGARWAGVGDGRRAATARRVRGARGNGREPPGMPALAAYEQSDSPESAAKVPLAGLALSFGALPKLSISFWRVSGPRCIGGITTRPWASRGRRDLAQESEERHGGRWTSAVQSSCRRSAQTRWCD